MPSFPLIALKRFRYNQRTIATGHRFEACSRRDAMLLKAIGNAKDAPRTPTKRTTKPVSMPEPESEPIAEPEPEPMPVTEPEVVELPTEPVTADEESSYTKRTYRRRDMTAESE